MRNLLNALILIISVLFTNVTGKSVITDIQFYEFGEHVNGEQISFMYNGLIPAFNPLYSLKLTSQKKNLKSEVTYIRVEYYNLISKVKVTYDPETLSLTFHTKFPFLDTPIGVVAYSEPIQNLKI